MTTPVHVAAAASLLASDPDDLLLVELAAWVLGAAGRPVPAPVDPVQAAHARVAAAAGAGAVDEVERLLEELLPTTDGGALLASACELVGPLAPDLLVEVAHQHPDRRFVGRMLAGSRRPARLLALLPSGPAGSVAIETIGELVIAGRDRGAPVEEAETRWAQVAAEHPLPLPAYRDVLLRITARECLDEAEELLVALGEEWGRDRIGDGARAVVARLARVDPTRAAALVGSAADPRDRLAWLDGLTWWRDLDASAVPVIVGLLDVQDPDVDLAVARVLAGTPATALLDRSLRSAGEHAPLDLAHTLAPGVHQLRTAGRPDVAERVRRHCLDVVRTEARDTFEVIAAPGPELVPWARTTGVP